MEVLGDVSEGEGEEPLCSAMVWAHDLAEHLSRNRWVLYSSVTMKAQLPQTLLSLQLVQPLSFPSWVRGPASLML